MLQHLKTPADFLDLAIRRKYVIVISWVLVSLASVIVAYNLPKTFRSTARLLIEAPIPTNIIDSGLSQYADLQIQSIYQKVLTTDNIISIIESHGLYRSLATVYDKYKLADLFRENLDIELSTSTLIPEGDSGRAQIAFSISFTYSDPTKPQEIASDVAMKFIDENDRMRTQRAIKTTDFLMEESAKLRTELQNIDSNIAQFKEQNTFSLPEQMEGNLATIDRTENELRNTDTEILATKERIAFLAAELARAKEIFPQNLPENAPRNKDDTLRILRAKYLQYISKYSASHPSVMRLEREIKALDPTFDGQTAGIGGPKKDTENQEQGSKNLNDHQKKPDETGLVYTTNPAYIGVETQYRSSQLELESLLQKKDYLKGKLENMHNIILQAPRVELEYNDLIRMRDNTMKKFNQLKDKLLDAKLFQSLEQQQQGQTLTILEQPIVPQHPEQGARRKVAIAGFLIGIIAGIALAFLLEFLEPGLKGYHAIAEVTGLMPLVIVPYIESPTERERKSVIQNRIRKVVFWTSSVFAVMTLVIAGILFLFNTPR